MREVRAELVSVGGAIVLALCILLSLAVVTVWLLADATSLQLTILFLLTGVSWVYLLDSCTEHLLLVDHAIEFGALFSRKQRIPLSELQAMLLVHEGFNLERGMESIEFRRAGRKPDRVPLGPCWQRHKLELFLHSVEAALYDPHLLEEIR